MQQAEALLLHLRVDYEGTCRIPAGSVEALGQAAFDWIARHKHDRNCCGCLLRCDGRCLASGRHEYVHVPLYELGSERGQPAVVAACPTIFNDVVLSLDEAAFAQSIAKGIENLRAIFRGAAAHEPDQRPRCLLRPRRERPRHRPAQPRDELAPSHQFVANVAISIPSRTATCA
jgi:hypothetical protein